MQSKIYSDERFSIEFLPEETMVYDKKNDRTHFLNPTAMKILELAYDGRSKEEIEKIIVKNFNISEDVNLSKDIDNAFLLFKEKGLVK